VGRFVLLTVGAAFAGLTQYASYQPTGLWWAAPLGFGLFFWTVDRAVAGKDPRTTRRWSVWLSWIQGLTCYLLLLPWVGEYVGAIAWFGLSVVESLYSLLFGLGLAALLTWSRTSAAGGRTRGLLPFLAVPAWYVAVEWLRSNWPFGGFGWVRLAWGQVGGPLAHWITLAGPALVAYAVVIAGLGIAVLVHRRWVTGAVTLVVTLVGGLVIPAVSPVWRSGDDSPTLNVAAVQGNVPRLGLDFNAQREAVLNNHLQVTRRLADEVDAGTRDRPDLVVWPENASDVDPFRNPDAYAQIQAAAEAVRAPILVGTITRDEVGSRNTIVVWDPTDGPGEQHVKKFLQPFGEYMPMRDLLRHVSSYVDLAGDYKPGDGPGTLHPGGPGGPGGPGVGVATCYEVSFDGAYRDAVDNGATMFASPTNNATFGHTDMTYQQLAINRMRAIEYDRAVAVAATSGVSAMIDPDGAVTQDTEIFRQGLLQADIPLRDTRTLSARLGAVGEWVLSAAGLAAALYAGMRFRKTTRRGRE
jgi:apolipoprotein N-acyltransferase